MTILQPIDRGVDFVGQVIKPVPSADYPARRHADFYWREQ